MAVLDPLTVALILTQSWHRVPGGTASSALGLTRALLDRDDIEVIGVGAGGFRQPIAPFVPPCEVRRLRLPYQLLYDAWHKAGRAAPEDVTGPVDLVHATTTLVPPVRKAKLVVTVHDMFPYLEPNVLTKRGARILQRGIDLARERAAIVCCPSQQTIEDCTRAGFDPGRLRLVPWGAHTQVATEHQVMEVRARLGLERPYLLWIGTVEPRKNLGMLLKAFHAAELEGIDLVIGGPDGWNEDLTPHLEVLGDRVRRLGFVAQSDMAPLYGGARAHIFPSHREGFGLPALEAMVQGTPVVGAAGTAIAEVVGNTGMLIDPSDLTAWTIALQDAADPAWKRRHSAPAQARAAEFTWERTAAAQMVAYHEAVA